MTCFCFKYCLCFFTDQAYQPHLIKLSTWHYCIHMLTDKSMYMYTNGTCEGYAWRQRNSHAAVGPSQHCLLPWLCTEQATCDCDHTHLIEFAHGCGYYSRAATISFTELQVWLLFKASFYSNKYSMHTINGNAVQDRLSENYIANMKIYYTKHLEHEMFAIYGTMYWGMCASILTDKPLTTV